MTNWVGKRLGRVQIESLLARGGVAEIYVGTHTTLERKVAVKILRNLSEGSDALVRFQREARVIAKLRHPNIVQVYDFDTVENDPYLVMELIEGPSLSQYLKVLHENHERLSLLQVIDLISAVASALQYAHNSGVIHRDIKPGNILLTSRSSPITNGKPLPGDVEPVLTDFGLVRFLDANRETTTGHIAGTPAYMSPEQARGEITDGRTDVYSLGIVLYELLAGHIPFDGETTMGILLKQVTEPPPPVAGLSPFIEDVLNHALAKDAKDRFQTPLEFANALRAAVNMDSEHATVELDALPKPFPPLTAKQPPKSRRRWIPAVLLVILALAVGAYIVVNARLASRAAQATPTLLSTVRASPSATQTTASVLSAPLGPTAILRFQRVNGPADQAILIAQAMPAPPAGSQYEVWLSNTQEHVSLGVFSPDETGKGQLIYSDPEGADLLARYDKVEITIEPKPNTDPEPSGLVAYAFAFPNEALTHLRYLLSSFPNTPDQAGLIPGLDSDIKQIDELVKGMRIAYEAGNRSGARKNAEAAFNILVGAQSAEYKDWNSDGVTNPGQSYGLLLNGSRYGYIQAAYGETDSLTNTSEATQYMISNGKEVKICTQNLASWAPQLHDSLLKILTSTSEADVLGAIHDSVTLADQMLNGIDRDGNGKIDPAAGECGVQLAYQYAYYMADMPLLPISPSLQLTTVATSPSPRIVVTPTRTRSSSQNPQSTPVPKATKKPNPTKKPQPTHKP